MKNWKQVPIPVRMFTLERDGRGFPVPWVVFVDNQNKAHFQINDHLKVNGVLSQRICGICGQQLDGDYWLVGGPMSAFHPMGAYFDSPSHHQCLNYAMQVCPYLAAPNYGKRLDDLTIDKSQRDQVVIDPQVLAARPDFFVCIHVSDYTVNPENNHIRAARPYLSVEVWRQGQLLDAQTAQQTVHLWKAHLEKKA